MRSLRISYSVGAMIGGRYPEPLTGRGIAAAPDFKKQIPPRNRTAPEPNAGLTPNSPVSQPANRASAFPRIAWCPCSLAFRSVILSYFW